MGRTRVFYCRSTGNLGLTRLLVSLVLAIVGIGAASSQVRAADICNAVALVDVPDWGGGAPADASGSVLKKGEFDDAVTEYQVNKKTGDAVFCSHGGYCYPRYLVKNGQKVEALRLTNCKIGSVETAILGIDDDTITYDVDVDRSKNSAADLKEDDVDNALLNIGMCSACAGNAADIYIKHPESKCGATVGKALAGDEAAVGELQGNPDYCDEHESATQSLSALTADVTVDSAPDTLKSQIADPSHSGGIMSIIKIMLIGAAILYFVPSVIAFIRRKRNFKAIAALNLLLGWSFLGWVAALIWSLLEDANHGQQGEE